MNYDLIVIGVAPGVCGCHSWCSIGVFNVAVVERAEQGGICLNWGCIPTKSLLKSAQVLEYAQHAEAYGIQIEHAEPDFQAIIARSRGVADKMSKRHPVSFFKKNNITVIPGHGKLTADKKVAVTSAAGEQTIYTKRTYYPGYRCTFTGIAGHSLRMMEKDYRLPWSADPRSSTGFTAGSRLRSYRFGTGLVL